MKKGKYDYLREQYPDMISLDQFYRICRISKRSAVYLVTNGIVPFTDTGKKTWRYRIAIDDVITYLRRREHKGSMIPVGAATSRNKNPDQIRKPFSEYMKQGDDTQFRKYFAYIYSDYPDVLTVAEAAEMTGLHKETILRYIREGEIKKMGSINKFIIPKHFLIEFTASQKFIECKSRSEVLDRLLQGYEYWRANQKNNRKVGTKK